MSSAYMTCCPSGITVDPLDLRVEDIQLEDIAHHLSCINRFNGALHTPVNVAQHSVYVSRLLDGTGLEMVGLLHDAPEAYLGDMVKWLKATPQMAAFREAEDRAWSRIAERFNLDPVLIDDPRLEEADRLMVRFEAAREGSRNNGMFHRSAKHPYPTGEEFARVGTWKPWSWQQSREAFLVRYRCIQNGIV
jgi:hypothetical protein